MRPENGEAIQTNNQSAGGNQSNEQASCLSKRAHEAYYAHTLELPPGNHINWADGDLLYSIVAARANGYPHHRCGKSQRLFVFVS